MLSLLASGHAGGCVLCVTTFVTLQFQDIMVSEGIIDMVVRCLARRYDEAEPAVLLLRVLSGKPNNAEKISHAHGAVLLLVTLLGSEHDVTAASVKAILENLPTSDENIVIMAEANLMKPLVTRLIDGKFVFVP